MIRALLLLVLLLVGGCTTTGSVIEYIGKDGVEIQELDLEKEVVTVDPAGIAEGVVTDEFPFPVYHKECRGNECFIQICIEQLTGVLGKPAWIMTHYGENVTTYVYAVVCRYTDAATNPRLSTGLTHP